MGSTLLDTDLLIWHLRGREHARRWIDNLAQLDVPCCSALSVTEIAAGMRPMEERSTRLFLTIMEVIPVSDRIAWRAGRLIWESARQGITLDLVDATIAASCLVHGLRLATYNIKHFPMPGLRLIPVPS